MEALCFRAYPEGTLINHADGREYSYLFWRGYTQHRWDLSEGFVVRGEDTVAFLQEMLAGMGLIPREYNEFIVYWVPQMQDNRYNIITFSTLEEYERVAGLVVSPRPDSILRIHMAWQRMSEPVDIPPQQFAPFERRGFTVVEWGGTEVLAN